MRQTSVIRCWLSNKQRDARIARPVVCSLRELTLRRSPPDILKSASSIVWRTINKMTPKAKKIGCFLLAAIAILMFLAPVALVGYVFYVGDDVPPDYTRHKPNTRDIVGTWVLDSESAREMVRMGGYKSANTSIKIESDGTFKAVDLPDCAYSHENAGWGFDKGTLASPSGKWVLEQRNFTPFFDKDKEDIQVWDISMGFDNLPGSLPPDPYPLLLNQSPPYVIHIPFGDPDGDEHLNFIKQ